MKIHEYQAKEIFRKYLIPVFYGEVARTPDEAYKIAKKIGEPVVVKAQVHVGGRGKAGGIKLANTPEEAKEKSSKILGMKIKDIEVKKVLVARAAEIIKEFYLGIIVNRESKKITIMASKEGGIEIEEVAKEKPEAIIKVDVDPINGLYDFKAREIAFSLSDSKDSALQIADIIKKLYTVFVENDCSIAEINPLIISDDNKVYALDAKIVFDDNSLPRHKELEALRDIEEEDMQEIEAKEKNLSFVKLDGDIGCIVNGAGLAMATMDLIKHYGGNPANFLDVGGSSSPEKMVNAFSILLKNSKVKGVLINIFGGITRCDDIANGILKALEIQKVNLPLVIRLTGTNENEGRKILESKNLYALSDMDEAVKKIVELSK